MPNEDAHLLTNDFRAVSLYSLQRWPEAASLVPPGTAGPYIVLQTAIDPDDPSGEVDDFLLGRNGRWLPLYLFHQLPKELRQGLYLYATAAEAIGTLEGLTGQAIVERGQSESSTPGEAEAMDPLDQAIAEVWRKGKPETPLDAASSPPGPSHPAP